MRRSFIGVEMGVSKKFRFEVLKRDGFKCVYCGSTPMMSALQVDHVVPVSKGGTDDADNLVTSCEPCNNGKRARPLSQQVLRKNIASEADTEHVEQIKEYLKLQKKIVAAKALATEEVLETWRQRLGSEPTPSLTARMTSLLGEFGYAYVLEAIDIVASKRIEDCTNQAKYFCGILRNWRVQR